MAAPPRRRRRRVLLAAAALAAVLLVAVAVLVVLNLGSTPTAEERQLVGQCVLVNGEAVQVVPCSAAHDGRITAVVGHYGDCPSGTSAFRLHPNGGNEHSACYVDEVTGTQ